MSPSSTNGDVARRFREQPELSCLPVVEDGKPIGLINRNLFFGAFSLPYHREIYERKSCLVYMDKAPLIVEDRLPIAALGRLAVEAGSKALNDGFIVVQEGRYLGIGSGLDLLRAVGQLESDRYRLVRESIEYAQVIQGSLLATSRQELAAFGFGDHHLICKPRDRVGGDAFFARQCVQEGRSGIFLALLDCTGHGVPGAFTAMLMTSFLGHALDLVRPWEPGQILRAVNQRVKVELGQNAPRRAPEGWMSEGSPGRADEGMDITCLWIESLGPVTFAGAGHSLWLLPPGAQEPEEIRGDRMGVGYIQTPDDYLWTRQTLHTAPGTTLYAMTDGLADQIGGPRRIAFGKRRLWAALAGGAPTHSIHQAIERCYGALEAYQGSEMRRDDLSLLGLRMGDGHGA